MLRKTIRLRKEYLFKKGLEDKERTIAERKRQLREAVEGGKAIPTELRQEAKKLKATLDLDNVKDMTETHSHIDDEYAYAGKVMLID